MKTPLLGGAIVTGGASGIGRALSEALAQRGFEVVVADRQQALAETVAEQIRSRGGQAHAELLDVRELDAWEALAARTQERCGRIAMLFNNAGVVAGGSIEAYAPRDWKDVIDVNLTGVSYGIQAVYPRMIAQRDGHIINTASIAGLVALPYEGSYGATKHAVVALSKILRTEAKQHGVRVSVLCPGAIRTPILGGGRFGHMDHVGGDRDKIMELWELLRPMPPDDFAREALRRVFRDEAIIVVPGWYKAFWYLDRLSTRLTFKLAELMLKQLKQEIDS